MNYVSTRSNHQVKTASEAILKGLAPDGGLYMPSDFKAMRLNVSELLTLPAEEISTRVIQRIFPEYSLEEMRQLIHDAYLNKFETADLTPICKVGDSYILELFRGPTSAFKDVALSVLPRLISASREKLGVREDIVILTATSGDTGKAALEGFRDVPGTRIVVFYPDGGVSDVQKAQMVTQEGGNVRVCAVQGNFDDAQTGVKQIFESDSQSGWAAELGVRLSSANSINLGRLAPQVAYYFKAYADLVLTGGVALGQSVNFVVPTGNFGDILAGEFARRMGLPVDRLICASNANDVLTDFFTTGRYDRRREFHKTISPSMDILVSSNLERCLYLYSGGDAELVGSMMRQLQTEGWYDVPKAMLQDLQNHYCAYSATDAEALSAIGQVWDRFEYLMDPHTAVGWSVRNKFIEDEISDQPVVVLSTASPYKFCRDVLSAISDEIPEDGFDAMQRLKTRTQITIPPQLANLNTKPVRFTDCIAKEEMPDYVKHFIHS